MEFAGFNREQQYKIDRMSRGNFLSKEKPRQICAPKISMQSMDAETSNHEQAIKPTLKSRLRPADPRVTNDFFGFDREVPSFQSDGVKRSSNVIKKKQTSSRKAKGKFFNGERRPRIQIKARRV